MPGDVVPRIIRVSPNEVSAELPIGVAMRLAFREGPNFVYIFQENRRRDDALDWFFGRFVLRIALRYGEVYTTKDRAGAACWMRPITRVSPAGALRSGILEMPFCFGWSSFEGRCA
jgi:hypothetical protein